MNTTQRADVKTVNTTDIRFRLGTILAELEKTKSPILVISRSHPKAWLYPYEKNLKDQDPFALWRKKVLPKYPKNAANDLIALIRKDRESR